MNRFIIILNIIICFGSCTTIKENRPVYPIAEKVNLSGVVIYDFSQIDTFVCLQSITFYSNKQLKVLNQHSKEFNFIGSRSANYMILHSNPELQKYLGNEFTYLYDVTKINPKYELTQSAQLNQIRNTHYACYISNNIYKCEFHNSHIFIAFNLSGSFNYYSNVKYFDDKKYPSNEEFPCNDFTENIGDKFLVLNEIDSTWALSRNQTNQFSFIKLDKKLLYIPIIY